MRKVALQAEKAGIINRQWKTRIIAVCVCFITPYIFYKHETWSFILNSCKQIWVVERAGSFIVGPGRHFGSIRHWIWCNFLLTILADTYVPRASDFYRKLLYCVAFVAGFLTAMRQEVTRMHKGWALDTVTLHNEVLKSFKEDITAPPQVRQYLLSRLFCTEYASFLGSSLSY